MPVSAGIHSFPFPQSTFEYLLFISMVNRPPPKSGGGGRADDSFGTGVASTRSNGSRNQGPKRGMEWSLRSLHSIDTGAQHFLSHFMEGEESESDSEHDVHEEDETAYEIFKVDERPQQEKKYDSVWSALNVPLRTGIVDGKKKVFELKSGITNKPETSRLDRVKRKHEIINANKSPIEVRLRLWLMHFTLSQLLLLFLGTFILVNVIFACLFWALEERCCGDPDMSFSDVFAFTVHTSTTIGYGTLAPVGKVANFLVVMCSYTSTLLNTLLAGLLFTRFVTPIVNIQLSEVMTMCNVNGVPCLSVRMGNPDGYANQLTDINVRLTYSFRIPYTDHKGVQKHFVQTEELRLLESRRHSLLEVWTLRHVLDESSPLFGLNFEEHPANKIYVFTLSVDAVQNLTKSSVNIQTDYALEDILVGHSFQNQVTMDTESKVFTCDYSKMSDTEPYPVWYPARAGIYNTRDAPKMKSFKP